MKRKRAFLLVFASFSASFSGFGGKFDAIREKAAGRLLGKPEFAVREVHRIEATQSLVVESFMSRDTDSKLALHILDRVSEYRNWALDKINEGANGKKYFIQLLDLVVPAENPNELQIFYKFEFPFIPLFRDRAHLDFEITKETTEGVFALTGKATGIPKSPVENVIAQLWLMPATDRPGSSWVYFRGEAKVRSRIIYEVLPDKVLVREAGERLRRILENYEQEDQRWRENGKWDQIQLEAKQASNTTKKKRKEKR